MYYIVQIAKLYNAPNYLDCPAVLGAASSTAKISKNLNARRQT